MGVQVNIVNRNSKPILMGTVNFGEYERELPIPDLTEQVIIEAELSDNKGKKTGLYKVFANNEKGESVELPLKKFEDNPYKRRKK